jgi:hypothetical protein
MVKEFTDNNFVVNTQDNKNLTTTEITLKILAIYNRYDVNCFV